MFIGSFIGSIASAANIEAYATTIDGLPGGRPWPIGVWARRVAIRSGTEMEHGTAPTRARSATARWHCRRTAITP
jgi:hypothetical protein